MKIKVAGVPGEFDMPDNFTFREMNFIKKMTGLRAGEVYPALEAGDTDVIAAFALTAIRRTDATVTEDDLMDLVITDIELIVEESDTAGGDVDGPPVVDGSEAKSESAALPPSSTPATTETPVTAG